MAIGNFGVIGTKHIDSNPIFDEAYLRSLETASGLNLADLFRRVDEAMGGLNGEVDALIAPYIYFTDNPKLEPRRTGRKFVQRGGEYTTARPQKVNTVSFMMGQRKYEISTGFTEDGLHEITLDGFDNELNAMIEAWQMLYLGSALETWFNPTLQPIAKRSAVLAPKFAGSGSGNYVFTGPYPNGAALDGGYTHYFRVAVADLATALKTQTARFRKWHPAPYDLFGTENAIDAITALDEFTWAAETGINPGTGERTAALDPDQYLGQLPGRVRVHHPVEALGSGSHYTITKGYGLGDRRNPLAWLYDPKWGRAAYVRSKEDYPLAESVVIQRFGINVSNPVGAIVTQIAEAGSYTAPTITF